MKTVRLIATLAAGMAIAGLAACGDDDSSSSGAQSDSSGSLEIKSSKTVGQTTGPNGEKATPTSAIELSSDEIAKVESGNYTAALVWHQASDFTTAVTSGAKDEFARLGIDIVATTNANFDPGKQKNDIETVMAKKPSVMLTLPVDPVTTASAYRAADKAGTKLVLLSNVPEGFKQGKDYVTVVTDDLFQMGKQAADALAAAIGGKGKIAYFFHDANYYVTNQRDQAFKKTIEANYPDIEIVAEQGIADPNKAQDQANAILVKNPDLDGIYVTFSQPPAEGVLSALRNNGNTKAKLVSLDLDEPLALDMARDGNVAALVTDRAYELGQAMARAAAYGLLDKQAPPFVVAPATTVTKDNLDQGYQDSLHQAPPKSVQEAAASE
jgi:ribose transport system substrate-binding protein